MAILPEYRHSFAKLSEEERHRIAVEAARKRWANPQRRPDKPGPRLVDPPKRTRNLTKFFMQRELYFLQRQQDECLFYLARDAEGNWINPVPHKFRLRPDWYRDEWLRVTHRFTNGLYWRKYIGWGAYVQPGRRKIRVCRPTGPAPDYRPVQADCWDELAAWERGELEWPFSLKAVPWVGWWKLL